MRTLSLDQKIAIGGLILSLVIAIGTITAQLITNKPTVSLEANNNSNSVITQVAGDINVNNVAIFSLTETKWPQENRAILKFVATSSPILPEELCIYIQTDSKITDIYSTTQETSNRESGWGCFINPPKEMFVRVVLDRKPSYFNTRVSE